MSNVKYIYHPNMFGGKVLKVVRTKENNDVWVCYIQSEGTGFPVYFRYMNDRWYSCPKPTSGFDCGRVATIAAFEATDENRDALSTLYPDIYFEAAPIDMDTKADKLLRMYESENRNALLICFVPDVGFVSILEFEERVGKYKARYTDGVNGVTDVVLTAEEVDNMFLLVGGYTLDIEEHEGDDNE